MKEYINSTKWNPPPLQTRAANIIKKYQQDISEAGNPKQKYLIAQTALKDVIAAINDATGDTK